MLVLSRGLDRKRYFKGIVFRIEHRGEYSFGSVARVDFATAVWAMRHGQDSRVFENQTAPQILEKEDPPGALGFSREALTSIMDVLAREKFEDMPEFRATPARLGVYRSEEHIDNPRGESPESSERNSGKAN